MRRLLPLAAASLALVASALVAPSATAAPGDLDTQLGGGTGTVALEWGLGPVGNTKAIASTAAGLPLLAGDNGAIGCLTRLTLAGARDTSFDASGATPGSVCNLASGANGAISNVTVTPSGSILLAFIEATGRRVVKLTAAGAVSFNTSLGAALSAGSEVLDVAELSDGRIAVLESDGPTYSSPRLVTILSATGSALDDWAPPAVSGWTFWPVRILPMTGAELVLAGSGENGPTRRALAQRLTSAGAAVTSFGTSGSVIGPVSEDVFVGARNAAGGFVLAAAEGRVVRVGRYGSTGVPVVGHGVSGIASVTLPGAGTVRVGDAVVAPDGRTTVLVNGAATEDAVMLARFSIAGAPDPVFGTGGVATWAAPGVETRIDGSLALAPLGDVYAHSDNTSGFEELLRFDGTTDTTAPVVAMTGPTLRWNLSTRVLVSWAATDPSGVASSDLRLRRASPSSGLPVAQLPALSATTARSVTLTTAAGNTLCTSVRARDVWGFTSAFTADRCTAVPLAPSQLSRTGAVTSVAAPGSYAGRALLAKARGATVSKAGVKTKRIVLVVTKCATCGSVAVYLGTTRLKTVSLTAPSLRRKQVVSIAAFSSLKSGTVRVVVTSQNRPVLIEGIGVSAV